MAPIELWTGDYGNAAFHATLVLLLVVQDLTQADRLDGSVSRNGHPTAAVLNGINDG